MKNQRRPEWKFQMWICGLVLAEKLSIRLGQIATVWATTVLVGGFVSGLPSYDFWVISGMALASTLRLFGSTQEHKLNQKRIKRMRHVLVQWLSGGYNHFCISSITVIAGSLDLLMFVLQLASAIVSLVLSILRIRQNKFGGSAQGANQKHAMKLYYTMVLAEALLFLPAKMCWALPFPREDKNLIFRMPCDAGRLSIISDLFDDYFMKVLKTARESVVQGLGMRMRWYISDMLVEESSDHINAAACIFILDSLHEPGERIKSKADVHKPAKLLAFLFQHIDDITSESREAAISLVTSLLDLGTSKYGPLVLSEALDSHPFLTEKCYLAQPAAKYLKTCLASRNRHAVPLGIDVVRRLPTEFLLSTQIVEVMIKQLDPLLREQRPFRHLAAMLVLRLGEHGLQSRIDRVQASRAVEVLLTGTRPAELEILVGLDAIGLISRKQKLKVTMESSFCELICLPCIVKWVSSLDDEIFHEIVGKRVKPATKERLFKHVEASRARISPDLIKLCRLLVRDSYFKSKIDHSPTLRQLLQPEEEC